MATKTVPKGVRVKGTAHKKKSPRWGSVNDATLTQMADQLQFFRAELLGLRFKGSQWAEDWEVEIDGAKKGENAINELTSYLQNIQSSLFRYQMSQPFKNS